MVMPGIRLDIGTVVVGEKGRKN